MVRETNNKRATSRQRHRTREPPSERSHRFVSPLSICARCAGGRTRSFCSSLPVSRWSVCVQLHAASHRLCELRAHLAFRSVCASRAVRSLPHHLEFVWRNDMAAMLRQTDSQRSIASSVYLALQRHSPLRLCSYSAAAPYASSIAPSLPPSPLRNMMRSSSARNSLFCHVRTLQAQREIPKNSTLPTPQSLELDCEVKRVRLFQIKGISIHMRVCVSA